MQGRGELRQGGFNTRTLIKQMQMNKLLSHSELQHSENISFSQQSVLFISIKSGIED